MSPRLKTKYLDDVAPALREQLGLDNVMQVPRFTKIVVNMGVGEAVTDRKSIESAMEELSIITGQKPKLNRARKSIAGFKIREGMPVGASVTLRGDRMWEFFDRLVSFALPRVRDFRGVSSRAFDGRGNYTLGIRDILIFPEVDYQKVEGTIGMNITITTSAPTDDQAHALLAGLGMPFARS